MPDARRRHARHRRRRAAHCRQLAPASTDVGPAGTIGPAHERAGSNTSAVILASIFGALSARQLLRQVHATVHCQRSDERVIARDRVSRSAVEGSEAVPLALRCARRSWLAGEVAARRKARWSVVYLRLSLFTLCLPHEHHGIAG